MLGRPKTAARKAKKLMEVAGEMEMSLIEVCPERCRNKPIYPPPPDSLFFKYPLERDITRRWKAVVGYAASLNLLLEELVELLLEKAELPNLKDLRNQEGTSK